MCGGEAIEIQCRKCKGSRLRMSEGRSARPRKRFMMSCRSVGGRNAGAVGEFENPGSGPAGIAEAGRFVQRHNSREI